MRFNTIITTIICAFTTAFGQQPINSIEQLAKQLSEVERYRGSAEYSVLLPTATDDITYSVELQSISSPSDSLSPCHYLIDWTLPTPSGESKGFSAYANGSHFRYRDERLQEYHFDWDSIPFLTRDGGVQRNAQFAELLPQNIAVQIKKISSDPHFSYKFNVDAKAGGRKVVMIEAVESYQGLVARNLEYTFDAVTGLPIKIETESNPGEITEQTMTVTFAEPHAEAVDRFAEDDLIARYPEIFEKYRQSNFRAENLPGTVLTSFSAPTLEGDRFTYDRNSSFPTPQIIVMLDPTVATTAATIEQTRETLSFLPVTVGVIWAFNANNRDQIEQLIAPLQPGEKAIISAKALARDSGITTFPTMLFVDRSGRIADVQLGYSSSLPEILLEKTAFLK